MRVLIEGPALRGSVGCGENPQTTSLENGDVACSSAPRFHGLEGIIFRADPGEDVKDAVDPLLRKQLRLLDLINDQVHWPRQ